MDTEKRQDLAIQHFEGEMNCAQAVLLAFADELEIERENLVSIGSAFGSGMGEGDTCGAVSAALMVIGLKNGKSHSSVELKEQVKKLSGIFKSEFQKQYGSLKCKDLTGVDLSTDQGYEIAHQKRVFQSRCPLFIRSSIQLIADQEKNTDQPNF